MAQSAAKMVEPTDDARAIYLMNHPDSVEDIPIIDMGRYLRGEAGADRQMAAELREVTETVGFFYLKNHPVPQQLIDRMFAESKRFFALPVENFSTTTGQHTNAVYGFTSMLINVLRDERPTHVAVAFDVYNKRRAGASR